MQSFVSFCRKTVDKVFGKVEHETAKTVQVTAVRTLTLDENAIVEKVVERLRQNKNLARSRTLKSRAIRQPTLKQAQIYQDYSHPSTVEDPKCFYHHYDLDDGECSCYHLHKYGPDEIYESTLIVQRAMKTFVQRKKTLIELEKSKRLQAIELEESMRLQAINEPTANQLQIYADYSHVSHMSNGQCYYHDYNLDDGDCTCYFYKKYCRAEIYDTAVFIKKRMKKSLQHRKNMMKGATSNSN